MKKVPQESNNNVFVATCRMTLFLLRIPPKNFETFIIDHFRERGNMILGACRAYASGHILVGHYSNGSCSLSSFPVSVHKVSRNFKQLLEQLYPLLIEEFRMIGLNGEFRTIGACNVVEHSIPLKAKKPNSWKISIKVFNKLGKILGLKKGNKKKNVDTCASDLSTIQSS
ncbi:PREDICTED: probable ubiquitin-conjugating enzyme E2 24-like [Fragaria vesca subsp. vesca]